jgi:hypothetical protein
MQRPAQTATIALHPIHPLAHDQHRRTNHLTPISHCRRIKYTAAPAVMQTFNVSPAVLTVTAQNLSMAYGTPVPALLSTTTGFVNGDSPTAVTGAPALATTATSTSPVGAYTITRRPGNSGRRQLHLRLRQRSARYLRRQEVTAANHNRNKSLLCLRFGKKCPSF